MQKHTVLLFLVMLFTHAVHSQNTAKEICSPITTFPFAESFNDTVFAPNCWKNYENDGSATTKTWKRVTAGTHPTCLPHNGTGMVMFDCWNYAAGVKSLLVSPQFNFPTDSYQVDFWMFRDNGYPNNADSINVYINSDTNLTGATLIGTVTRSNNLYPVEPLSDQWYHYSFNLPSGIAGANKHIIIEGVSKYGMNIFLDDVRVSETPPCPLPSGWNVTALSGSTANIGWNSSANAISWDIEYGPVGYNLGSGSTINTATNSVPLTGLTRLTNYSYYIRANCGATEGFSEWSGPHFFTTICDPESEFPYTESFDDSITFVHSCWKNIQTAGSGTSYLWARNTVLTYTGSGSASFNCRMYATGNKAILVSKTVDLPNEDFQLSFRMYKDGNYLTSSDSVNVYYNSNSDLNGATLLGTLYRPYSMSPVVATPNKWYPFNYKIPQSESANCKYIIFEGVSKAGNPILIDDFKLEPFSNCIAPINLMATAVDDRSATLKWSSPNDTSSWTVQYGVGDFLLGAGTIIASDADSLRLSNLLSNTEYSFYVQTNCGDPDGLSNWSGPVYFTTQCTPISQFPFTESFNDTLFAPTCWKNIQTAGTGTNLIWARNAVTPYSGTASASFNCRTYAAGTKAILVSKIVELPNEDFQLSFWMYKDGSYAAVSDSLNVYYNSSPNLSGATILGTVSRSFSLPPVVATPNKWYPYSFKIPQNESANCKYIIFEGVSKAGNPIKIDDITLDTFPHCSAPSNLMATAIADSGATLKWSSANSPVSWNVQYGVGNFALGSGTIRTADADSLVVTDLLQNTMYSFFVQANCGGSEGLSNWSGPYFFTTLVSCPSPTGLTVSNILDTSVTLSWNPGGTESAWNIEYLPYGGTPGTGTTITVTSNPYILTGLNPNTKYSVYLQANCGGSDGLSTLAIGSVSDFTTLCTPISAMPYVESFDGTTFPPGCWKNISTPSYLSYFWARSTSGTTPTCTPHSGLGMANFPYTSNTGIGGTLITPPLNIPSDFYVVKLWMFRDNGLPLKDDSVNVYYSSVPSKTTDAVLLGTIHRNNTKKPAETIANQWYPYTFQLPVGSAGNNRFVLIEANRNAGTNIFIDDFTVEEQPPCRAPINLSTTAIKSTEVTLSWTSKSAETSWNIEYGLDGFVKGTGTVIASGTNPTTITGLSPNTKYQCYVQANCGGVEGVSLWTGPLTFSTSCQALTTLPFSESFDGTTFPPTCWSAIKGNDYSYWARATSSSLGIPPHTGAGFLSLLVNSNQPGKRAILSTPPISLPSDGYELGFWLYRDENEREDSINIYLSNQPSPNNGVYLSSLHNKSTLTPAVNQPNQWYYYSFPFPAGSAGDYKYVVFEGVGVGGTKRIVIDDVQIYTSPSCPKPTELTATAITSNSADLGWTSNGTESSWQVQYGISGFLLGTGTNVTFNSNPATLSGLNMGYSYSYYVKADCGNNDTLGVWAGPYFFATACDTISSFPYTESFSSPLSQCWSVTRGAGLGTIIDWTPAITDGTNGVVGPQSGTHFMKLNVYSYGSSQNNPYRLSTPYIKLDSTPKRMTYFYFLGKTGNRANPLTVQVSADHGATWNDLYVHDTTNSVFSNTNALTGWKKNAVYLDGYLNQTVMLRFAANSNSVGYGNGFCNLALDEVVVENLPDCLPPTASIVTNVRDTSAVLNWTAPLGDSSWVVEYGVAGFTHGNGITVNADTNLISIHGLTPSTQYEYYIKTNCGLGLVGNWGGPYLFKTTCPMVSNLRVAFTSNSVANLNWTPNGTETSWKVEYGISGFVQGTGTLAVTSSKPFTISGLLPNSSYSFYVQPICSGSDTITAWTGPFTFDTPCEAISTFPIVESFNDTTFAPNCWKNIQTGGTVTPSLWKRATAGTYPTCTTHSGSGMAFFNSYYYFTNTRAALVTKPFVVDTGYYNLSFWMYRDNGYLDKNDSVNIYYSNCPTLSDGVLLGTIHRQYIKTPIESTANQWYRYSYLLPIDSSGYYKYVIFEATSLYGNNIYLDDIEINKINCPEPSSLSATSITDSSAILKWTPIGLENSWQLEYGPVGFAHGSGIVKEMTSTSDTVYGLTNGTVYQFYVKAHCEDSDSLSSWAGPYSFRTKCVNITSLSVSDITASTAAVHWTSDQAAVCIMEVGHTGFTPGTGSSYTLYGNPYTIPYLLPNTSYDVYVKGYCSPDYGPLSGPITFTTSCNPVTGLSSSNITDTSADLSWTPGCTENSWNIEYGIAGFTHGTGTTATISTNSYSLVGLNANTTYQYYVQANCSGTNAWVGPFSFKTKCNTVAPLPFAESFDGEEFTPDCWSNIQTEGTDITLWSRVTSGSNPYCPTHSGAGMARFNSRAFPYGNKAILVTPQLNVSKLHQVSFWMYRDTGYNGYSDSLNIYYGDSLSTANAVYLGSIHRNYLLSPTETDYNNWHQYFFSPADTISGNFKYVIFEAVSNNGNNMFIDDIKVDYKLCPVPSNLSASNILATSATLGWTAGGTETEWNIEYGPTGFVPGTGILISSNSNSFTISGLNSSTQYQYYVQANCGSTNGTSYWAGPYNFTTMELCPAPVLLQATNFQPHSADVNWGTNYSEVLCDVEYGPTGFAHGTGTTISTANYHATLANLTSETSYDVYVRSNCGVDGVSNWVGPVIFSTIEPCPAPVLLQATDIQPNSAYVNWGTNYSEVLCDVEYGPTGFAHGTGTTVSTSNYNTTLANLIPETSYDVYVRSNCGVDGASIWAGPVTFITPELCPRPAMPTANFITNNVAKLTWIPNGTETSWNVQYGISGYTLGAGTSDTANSNQKLITGLAANTSYDFYVQANCGGANGISAWVGPYPFQTAACEPITSFPFTESFDDTLFAPFCWRNIHSFGDELSNAWSRIDTGLFLRNLPHTGSGMASLINDISSPYSEALLVTPPLNIPDDLYQVKFWIYRNNLSYGNAQVSVYYNSAPSTDGATLLGMINKSFWESPVEAIPNQWYQYTFHLPAGSAGNTRYIVFDGVNDSDLELVLDDITVNRQECPPPTALAATSNTATSEVLSWTPQGSESAWTVEYGLIGVGLGSGYMATANDTSLSISALTPSTNYRYYVRSNCSGDDSTSAWAGPFYFTTADLCLAPTDLYQSDVTNESALIHWTPTGTETNWTIVYHPMDLMGDYVFSADTNPFTITGLTENTGYVLYVFANCGDTLGNSQWAGPIYFYTKCNPITEFPFIENFNDTLQFLTSCWANYALGISTQSWAKSTINTSTVVPYDGLGMAQYQNYGTGYQQSSIFSLPPLNLPSDYFELGFWIYRDDQNPGSRDSVNAYYNTSLDTAGATFLGTIHRNSSHSPAVSTPNAWYHYSFDLPAGSGGNLRYLFLKTVCDEGNIIYLDDIQVKLQTCDAPALLTTTSISSNGAILDWISEDTEAAWNLRYKKTTDATFNEILNTTIKPYPLTGLDSNTAYLWNIQAICNISNSDWSGENTFNTLNSTIGVSDTDLDGLSVFSFNSQVNVINSDNIWINDILIYDLLGKEVGRYSINSTDNILINTNLTIGNYVVKVITAQQVGTYKLFIK